MTTFTFFWRHDGLVVNAEAVAEDKRLAGFEIRLDVGLVGGGLLGVGNRNHDHIREANGLGCVENFKALRCGDCAALGLGIKTDDDFTSALFKIQSVGVPLGTEAENREGFSFEKFEVGVFVGEDFGWHGCLFCSVGLRVERA